jgi:hypothetical protein
MRRATGGDATTSTRADDKEMRSVTRAGTPSEQVLDRSDAHSAAESLTNSSGRRPTGILQLAIRVL